MFQISGQTLKPNFYYIPKSSPPPPPRYSLRTTTSATDRNQLIQSLCKKGELKQAIHLLSNDKNNNYYKPTQQTFQFLIQSTKSLSDAFTVHNTVDHFGFDQDPFLATKLIDMYSHFNSIQHARQVFDKITQRTIYVWNAFLRALTLSGFGDEVFRLYVEMNQSGIVSDRFTYTYALKACVVGETTEDAVWKGKEIHARVLRHGYESNVHIMTTLVDVYAKFGFVENANSVFCSMPVKNVVSWSAMIACFAKNDRPFEALQLFREMMVETGEEVLPNSVTMVSVLQACAALAALEQGKFIHGYILRKGLDTILPITSALMTMYAKCGDINLAQTVFNQMKRRDTVSWNSLISSYTIHGLGAEALRVYREMVQRGVNPSPITFVSLLAACSHSGLVDEGKLLFDSMVTEHGIYPTVEHYACMVDLLGRANRLDEAYKIIADMRHEPGPKVWGSLLGSCRIHCNVELGEIASKTLFALEPTNAGNYVLLAEIYAQAKMWEEVRFVKKLLESRGLQKVSGCCWIEIQRKVYALKSVDELNPQIEQIHALVVELSKEMMDKGYVPDTKAVLYDLEEEEKEQIVLGHSEKLAVAFGLINCKKGETIRITKNLRLCEDCHSFTKSISKFTNREILVRDINRYHHFKDGECSCRDYW